MPEAFAVVCSWCNLLVKAAPAGTLITHTICPECIARTIAPLESRAAALADSAPLPPEFVDDAFKH
jgi:hypothetical protein